MPAVPPERTLLPPSGIGWAKRRNVPWPHTLLAVRTTDENGRIAPVRVATPDPAASESPGTPHPFASCDVWVEAPGYEMLYLENMQVFPNTETLQEVDLIPLPEQAPPASRGETVNVTPQEL